MWNINMKMVMTRLILLISLILMSFIADTTAINLEPMFADYIDYDTIISKDYLLKPYMDCIMEKAKCTNDGKYLKKALPFIVKTECKYCTDKQKRKVAYVIRKFQEYQPEQLEILKAKYDPQNYHWEAFQKLVEIKKPSN